MKKKLVPLAAVLVAAAAAGLAVAYGSGPSKVAASSHRDAPLISEDPTADNTDLYAFRSDSGSKQYLNVVSNWIPSEDPAAGPNYYRFSATARYNIFVDKNGDGVPDVTWRFQFQNPPAPTDSFLGTTAQAFTVTKITAAGSSQQFLTGTCSTPPANIGVRTTPNYHALATGAICTLPDGSKVFAGQRDDAFFGDIGDIFDSLGIRRGTGDSGGGKDFFAGYAVHAIALQIPRSRVDPGGNHTIGVWASTDRRRISVVGGQPTGRWVQVSRLGNPLFNEVLIPTALKDEWNGDTPAGDSQYAKFALHSILAHFLNVFYPQFGPFQEDNRTDLQAVFLTGVPGLNYTGTTLADELRLNLSIPPTAAPNRLGVLGGDLQGWPNGRRLDDDVIDIAERAVGGALIGHSLPLGDGVDHNDVANMSSFPWEADPQAGSDNTKGVQLP
jgi:hypothetical protein